MKAKAINPKKLGILLAILTIFFNLGLVSWAYHQDGIECTDCHSMHGQETSNIKLIWEQIPEGWNFDPIVWETVVFTQQSPDHYADGSGSRICEVCHDETNYYRTDGLSPGGSHHVGEDCMTCHAHCDEFMHGGVAVQVWVVMPVTVMMRDTSTSQVNSAKELALFKPIPPIQKMTLMISRAPLSIAVTATIPRTTRTSTQVPIVMETNSMTSRRLMCATPATAQAGASPNRATLMIRPSAPRQTGK